MRKLSAIMLGAAIMTAAVAHAQVMSTTAISDQFTTGLRGNAVGTASGGSGSSKSDGTEFLDYSGADATGTPIRYINSYAGASGSPAGANDTANGESPVQAIATILQPDRNIAFSALTQAITIPANTRPGATSASNVLTISDDGGQNTLNIGDPTSTNYFAQVDFFAIDRSANSATTQYEGCYLTIRGAHNGDATDFSYTTDRDPSYYILYDYEQRTIKFVKSKAGTTSANVILRTAGTSNEAEYGTAMTSVTSAWHTARIEAVGGVVHFYVDGVFKAANTGDATPILNGRAQLGYRSGGGVAGTNESAGVFDNFSAGPISVFTSVNDWTTYN